MFSYYGAKSKIVKHYPEPTHNQIIEPFAGAAWYSLRYFDHDVTLIEQYEVVVDIWHYLQQASATEILNLPPIVAGTKMRCDSLSDAANNLMSFCGNRGGSRPYLTAGTYKGIAAWWESRKKWIAENLHRIRHWKIIHGDYTSAYDIEATWFIDPPYQFGGNRYKHNKVDYVALSEWAMKRHGQVIVCENSKANWMDFKPLVSLNGQKHRTIESMWYRAA